MIHVTLLLKGTTNGYVTQQLKLQWKTNSSKIRSEAAASVVCVEQRKWVKYSYTKLTQYL